MKTARKWGNRPSTPARAAFKLSLVLVIAALGFFNWRIATPRLHSDAGAAQLRRAATMETVAGAAVLLVTAVLVALSPP